MLKNWNLLRVFRLFLGVAIAVQGVYTQEWGVLVMGILFTLLSLFNIGCCGAKGCDFQDSNSYNNKKTEEVYYEEVL